MSSVTITHPLALDETPDEPLPRRVTVERDGTNYRELVGDDGTFEGTAEKAREIADEWGVTVPDVTDAYEDVICAAKTVDGSLCEHPAGACPVPSHGE